MCTGHVVFKATQEARGIGVGVVSRARLGMKRKTRGRKTPSQLNRRGSFVATISRFAQRSRFGLFLQLRQFQFMAKGSSMLRPGSALERLFFTDCLRFLT